MSQTKKIIPIDNNKEKLEKEAQLKNYIYQISVNQLQNDGYEISSKNLSQSLAIRMHSLFKK
jgi:hypothetical protein